MGSTPDAMVLKTCEISKVRKIGGAEHDLIMCLNHHICSWFQFSVLTIVEIMLFVPVKNKVEIQEEESFIIK